MRNNLGQIVGMSYTGGFHAFLWQNGTNIDLNSRIAPNLGIVLTDAIDINDYGQIVCIGISGGQRRVYLLTR